MSNKVGSKGQVVIEKSIRDALSILPGSVAVQRLVGDRVEIRFLPPEHNESLFGILADYVTRSVSDAELERAIQAATEAASMERLQRSGHG